MPDITRRAFLTVTGAIGTVAAATPFKKYIDKLVPYVKPPEKTVPGEWTPYATTCRECPAGCGMHLMHRDGRVTKAEGNPHHPVNRGGLCPRGQSSLQGLYDPDRIKGPQRRDRKSGRTKNVSWQTAFQEVGKLLEESGGKVAMISRLETGTLRSVMERFVASSGSDRLLLYEPYNLEPLRGAHQLLFGMPVIPDYRLDLSGHVVSFGADFLEAWTSPVGFARRFGEMHSWRNGRAGRFTYVGPRLSMTAGSADDFLLVAPGTEQWVALAMLQTLAEEGKLGDSTARAAVASLGGAEAFRRCGIPEERIREIARSFAAEGGIALASPDAASGRGPVDTAVAAGLLNVAAGSIGARVDFSRPHALGATATTTAIETFLDRIDERDIVVIHETNIAFTRPTAVARLRKAAAVVYLGTLPDETAELADWLLPLDSPPEAWGDYEPVKGIHSLSQPTMARLYDTKGCAEILAELGRAAGRPLGRQTEEEQEPDGDELLKSRWRAIQSRVARSAPFEIFFADALRRGFVSEEVTQVRPRLLPSVARLAFAAPQAEQQPPLRLWMWPSIMLYDGRTANRGWLQEAPDPVSYASWSSWIDLHPKLAKKLGIRDGEVVEVKTKDAAIHAPARVTEEVADGVAGLTLGQGHTARGLAVAFGIGANGFLLVDPKDAGAAGFPGVSIRGTGKIAPAVYTSPTKKQFDREIVKWARASELRHKEPGEGEEIDLPTPEGYDPKKNMFPPHEHRLHRWGMIVDLQKCIGCGACAVACYAENNIPVMGREKLAQGREMAWLKVVPYDHPEKENRIGWLPMLCQHCDSAPCEPVCPVYAAVHNEEGLNAQIYNRCIGTRYCSNNCPYKVRRFNWFDPKWRAPLELQLNPEVTVRCRGVMEKCTFCVQRIRKAEYTAIAENRPVREGEVVPACAQSCPAGVYSFGDLMDEKSEFLKRFRDDPRHYQVLKELNTKSAVIYLKRIDRDG